MKWLIGGAIVGAILFATLPQSTALWWLLLFGVGWMAGELRAIRIVLSRTMLGVDDPFDHHGDGEVKKTLDRILKALEAIGENTVPP